MPSLEPHVLSESVEQIDRLVIAVIEPEAGPHLNEEKIFHPWAPNEQKND
jgi:hypothetical protein